MSYGRAPSPSSLGFSLSDDQTRQKTSQDTMEIALEKADSNRAPPEFQSKSVNVLSHSLSKPIKKRDTSGTNFQERWRTLIKTGCELHQDYGARVYFSISIPRTRKDFVFRSGKEVSPILPSDLVSSVKRSPQDGYDC